MKSTSLKIVLTIVFISLATPIFSQSTKVYEYWLDKFLLPNLRQKFNDHKIIDEISVHLKGELATILKVKKLLNKGVQAEFSEPAQYFNQELIAHKSRIGKENLKNFEKILNNLENIYEVDKHILPAIWANETFIGKVLPKFDASNCPNNRTPLGLNTEYADKVPSFLDPKLYSININVDIIKYNAPKS